MNAFYAFGSVCFFAYTKYLRRRIMIPRAQSFTVMTKKGGFMYSDMMREKAYGLYREKLEEYLGIPKKASEKEIHELIRSGLPSPSAVKFLFLGKVSRSELNKILTPDALTERLSLLQSLTQGESDQLYRVAHITILAEVVFGSDEKAARWLSKPKNVFWADALARCCPLPVEH